ncbi:putative protein kinase C substrate protein, heavy chain [Trypanosoma vivax]|nr:putative protein kinase C substrate protein, heavy chain [Trypanosoma vivax]
MVLIELLVVLLCFSSTFALEPSYGVQDALLKHYASLKEEDSFKCLNGDASIIGRQVNDNYCDCSDGSDEPGTSACTITGGKYKTPKGWMFRCKNIGFKLEEINHNRVNDGICDCCDGSDEYSGLTECKNNCAEKQEHEAEKLKQEESARQLAISKKQKMIQQVLAQRESDKVRVTEEKMAIEKDKKTLEELKGTLPSLEAKEKAKKDSLLEEYQVKLKAAGLDDDDAGLANLAMNCRRWRTTKRCADDAVETGARGCDEHISASEAGYCDCIKSETNATTHYEIPCNHGPLQCSYVCSNSGKEGTLADGEDKMSEKEKISTFELPEAKEVREKIVEIERKISALSSSLEATQSRLSRPYNTEDIMRTLTGECFTLDFRSYTYELCPFKDVHQYSKGTKSGSNIGRWGRFGESTYSLWSTTDDLTHMLYENGNWCWSGSSRVTDVRVICGPENKLLNVDEPMPCKYTMVFQTPAVCE